MQTRGLLIDQNAQAIADYSSFEHGRGIDQIILQKFSERPLREEDFLETNDSLIHTYEDFRGWE